MLVVEANHVGESIDGSPAIGVYHGARPLAWQTGDSVTRPTANRLGFAKTLTGRRWKTRVTTDPVKVVSPAAVPVPKFPPLGIVVTRWLLTGDTHIR
jgi:hypothetical protein